MNHYEVFLSGIALRGLSNDHRAGLLTLKRGTTLISKPGQADSLGHYLNVETDSVWDC